MNLVQFPELLSLAFDPAVVGSEAIPFSEGSTDYEITYHHIGSHFHLESISSVSATKHSLNVDNDLSLVKPKRATLQKILPF